MRRVVVLGLALGCWLSLALSAPGGLAAAHAEPTVDAATAGQPATEESGFRTSGVAIATLPVGARPYDTPDVMAPSGDGVLDGTGVRMFPLADGSLVDHPVAQAQYGLRSLNSYRLTGDRVYLDRAVANAQRLVDRRVESRGGWYFPYGFDWTVNGDTTQTIRAPWYSAMAEGQALSLFVRLYRATGADQWKQAADATFTALDSAPVPGEPFVSWVDSDGHLWLEEYPRPGITDSERVLNGHVFAMYGVYDYWLLTGDARARRLFDGAVTTVHDTALSRFRRPDWVSIYSLRHACPLGSYHPVHIALFQTLFQITGDGRFAKAANLFSSDYPTAPVDGTGTLAAGTSTAYQLDAHHRVVGSRRVSLRHAVSVPVDGRARAFRGPVLLRVAGGRLAGWWFPERYGRAWLTRPTDVQGYRPRALKVGFRPGTYVGYRYDAAGQRVRRKALTFRRTSWAPTTHSADVAGRRSFRFTTGAWAGYWVPMSSKMLLGSG